MFWLVLIVVIVVIAVVIVKNKRTEEFWNSPEIQNELNRAKAFYNLLKTVNKGCVYISCYENPDFIGEASNVCVYFHLLYTPSVTSFLDDYRRNINNESLRNVYTKAFVEDNFDISYEKYKELCLYSWKDDEHIMDETVQNPSTNHSYSMYCNFVFLIPTAIRNNRTAIERYIKAIDQKGLV